MRIRRSIIVLLAVLTGMTAELQATIASYDAWAEALLDPELELTPPPWAPEAAGLEDFYPMITGFVGIWPDVDFIHDRPRIP
jgi:hypothetical protein